MKRIATEKSRRRWRLFNRNSNSSRSRRGAAAVEFALVAPIFFIFLMGIIELGRVMMVQNVLINASREGARLAVIEGISDSQVKEWTKDRAAAGGVVHKNVQTTVTSKTFPSQSGGQPIHAKVVEVKVPFKDVSWLPTPWFFRGMELRASTTMRRESFN